MNVGFLIGFVSMLIFFGCTGKEPNVLEIFTEKIKAVPKEKWDILAEKKIFFGHQSVGQNILEGLEVLTTSFPMIRLNIVETLSPEAFSQPVFAHARIGRNRDPLGKIDHFRNILESGVGQAVDVAFFKLCYVDVVQTTDIETLIRHYDETLCVLSNTFPKLKIIIISAPLTNVPKNPRARIKRLLGKGPSIKTDNIKRNTLNNHFRQKYGHSLWDLAEIETIGTYGRKAFFRAEGKNQFLLHPDYTYDGGHLNSVGSQVVASDLLLYLLGYNID